mgnify:CR=1 FL=1
MQRDEKRCGQGDEAVHVGDGEAATEPAGSGRGGQERGLAPDLALEVARQLHRSDPLRAHARDELGFDVERLLSARLPVNLLLYLALLRLYAYYGEEFKVECPTGSGQMMTLLEVAKELGEHETIDALRKLTAEAVGARAAIARMKPDGLDVPRDITGTDPVENAKKWLKRRK